MEAVVGCSCCGGGSGSAGGSAAVAALPPLSHRECRLPCTSARERRELCLISISCSCMFAARGGLNGVQLQFEWQCERTSASALRLSTERGWAACSLIVGRMRQFAAANSMVSGQQHAHECTGSRGKEEQRAEAGQESDAGRDQTNSSGADAAAAFSFRSANRSA